MKDAGTRARKALRGMSNDQLTAWIEENLEGDNKAALLALPRGGRIKAIAAATERQFAEDWNAARAKKEEERKAAAADA